MLPGGQHYPRDRTFDGGRVESAFQPGAITIIDACGLDRPGPGLRPLERAGDLGEI